MTQIADKAFKNNKYFTQITVGTNVENIGKEAFSGCKNLNKIIIQTTKLKKCGKNSFAKINKKAVIKVPKKKLKDYTKKFKAQWKNSKVTK